MRFGTHDGHHDGFLVTMCDCSMYGWSLSLLPVEPRWHPSRLITLTLFKTWDQKVSSGMLLTFMPTHLFQFRFADTEQYWLITFTLFKTWDQKLSSGLLLTFMTTHLFQFRFADTEQ